MSRNSVLPLRLIRLAKIRSTMNDFSERMIRGELLLLDDDVKPLFLFLDPGIFTRDARHSLLDYQLLVF